MTLAVTMLGHSPLFDGRAAAADSLIAIEAHLVAGDGGADDFFGNAIAISGDTAVVGAHTDDNAAGINAGAAYVFVRSGGAWTQQQKLTATDAAASDRFGVSVAISGDTIVVGAHFADVGTEGNAGKAYVFVRGAGAWAEQQILSAGDFNSSDNFGAAVDTDGTTVVVGANSDNAPTAPDVGPAYVFARGAGVWAEQQKLALGDVELGDNFGNSVALDGNNILVGVQFDDTASGTNTGSAYLFVRDGLTWTLQKQLAAGDASPQDRFGSAVALDGDTAAIGATADNTARGIDSGPAYIIQIRRGVGWRPGPHELLPGDLEPGSGRP